jgi:hypothetical protein
MFKVIDLETQQTRGKFTNEAAAYILADRLCFEEMKLFIVSRA